MAEHSRLEPFLLLARSTKGAAAAKVVLDATAATGVYTFAELMDVPNVRDLANDPTYAKQARMLDLFAYGTLRDYAASPDSYPPLTPAHETKLKHLTLVSLALTRRALSYAELSEALNVSSTRELENLVIDAIYAGLLGAKMHQHQQTLHVDWVTGRDVRPSDVAQVKAGLETWCQNASTLLAALDEQIAVVRQEAAAEAERDAAYQRQLDSAFLAARKEVENKANKSRGMQPADNSEGASKGDNGADAQAAGGAASSADERLEAAIIASMQEGPSEAGGDGPERRGSRGTDARSVESIDEPRKKRAKD